MDYYVMVERGGEVFFVTSPQYNVFELNTTKTTHLYLWQLKDDALGDTRWHHLVRDGDKVDAVRRYRG